MRLPALCVLVLLLSGCFGPGATVDEGAPRLMTPTEDPALVPWSINATNRTPDLDDAGYLMPGSWSVGDEWHYVSNRSHFRILRVMQAINTTDGPRLVLEDLAGPRGSAPQTRAVWWMDPRTFGRDNLSYPTGTLSIAYEPPATDWRFLRNGSFAWEETHFTNSIEQGRFDVRANSYFAGFQTIPLLWGKVAAGRVEHRFLRTDAEGEATRELVVRFPFREYGNDVQYQQPDGELFRLVHVRYGGLVLGQPLSW